MNFIKSITDPMSTPVLPGGTVAIKKSFFDLIGKLDDGMEVWAGIGTFLNVDFRSTFL